MTSQNKKNVKVRFIILGVLFIGALFFYFQKEKSPLPDFSSPVKPVMNFNPKPAIPQAPSVTGVGGVPAKNAEAAKAQEDLTKNLNDSEKKQFQVFTEILVSKNDNDPRMDKDLRHLTPALKKALENQYSLLPDEKRNEKGLVTFLIARDLATPEDAQFLEGIFAEKPCLSLADCNVRTDNDPHFAGMNETSLVYPQVAGLFQLEQQLAAHPELLNNPQMKSQLQNLMRTAEQYQVPAIQKRATDLKSKFGL